MAVARSRPRRAAPIQDLQCRPENSTAGSVLLAIDRRRADSTRRRYRHGAAPVSRPSSCPSSSSESSELSHYLCRARGAVQQLHRRVPMKALDDLVAFRTQDLFSMALPPGFSVVIATAVVLEAEE